MKAAARATRSVDARWTRVGCTGCAPCSPALSALGAPLTLRRTMRALLHHFLDMCVSPASLGAAAVLCARCNCLRHWRPPSPSRLVRSCTGSSQRLRRGL